MRLNRWLSPVCSGSIRRKTTGPYDYAWQRSGSTTTSCGWRSANFPPGSEEQVELSEPIRVMLAVGEMLDRLGIPWAVGDYLERQARGAGLDDLLERALREVHRTQ